MSVYIHHREAKGCRRYEVPTSIASRADVEFFQDSDLIWQQQGLYDRYCSFGWLWTSGAVRERLGTESPVCACLEDTSCNHKVICELAHTLLTTMQSHLKLCIYARFVLHPGNT